MTTADEARVRAVVAALRSDDRRSVLAIRADPIWSGPEILEGSPRVRVVPAQSPLVAREAVVRHAERDVSGELLVLLTQCGSAELGLDLRAQMVKGEVQSFDPFTSALALFQAKVLDPALARERWLIEDLISLAPANGWRDRTPINGVLTFEVAWATWQEARLDEASVPESLSELIELGENAKVRRLIGQLGEARVRLADRWAPGFPSAAAVIVDILAGPSEMSPTALGIVVGLLWAVTDDVVLAQRQMLGRARLESVLGRDRLTAADAVEWGRASTDRLAMVDDASGLVAEAERLLGEIDARELSSLSDVLPWGFDARLDRLGGSLGTGDLAGSVAALAAIESHALAPRRSRQVAACRAGVRLLRRSGMSTSEPVGSVPDRAVLYRADLAWVEQARRDLAAGAQSASLAGAFGALAEQAADVQRAADAELRDRARRVVDELSGAGFAGRASGELARDRGRAGGQRRPGTACDLRRHGPVCESPARK